ncbi:MAG: 50S ribosomal protein L10 [Candidatus Paceibacterota bacterium]|jgi:large subunit ribosomal protein L10
MAITKEQKSEIIAKVKEIVTKGKSIVFVNFHGLTVAGVNELRRNLRAKGIGYYVAKKTLIKRAFDGSPITGVLPELDGEVAVAYGEDALAPVKEIYDFHKKNAEVIKIIGGVFEGAYAAAEKMLALAKIPGREILLGQFVNVINSPIQGLVIALDALAKKKESGAN